MRTCFAAVSSKAARYCGCNCISTKEAVWVLLLAGFEYWRLETGPAGHLLYLKFRNFRSYNLGSQYALILFLEIDVNFSNNGIRELVYVC